MRPVNVGFGTAGEPIRLTERDLSTHMLVAGGTGRGKSTFIEYLVRGLALRGAGFTVIDPHGSLAANLCGWLARAAPHRRVHVIEPSARQWSFGFNPLAFDADSLSTGIQSVAHSIAAAWGSEDMDEKPRLRRVLAATLCLLGAHALPLADAVPVLSPSGVHLRRRLAERLPSAFFRGEWQQFALMSERDRLAYFESVSNRLGPLLASDATRAILGQTERTLDVASIMDARDIVIVNLRPSPRFSVEDGKLLGSLLVNAYVQRALCRRPGAPLHTLVIDEAARFVNDDIQSCIDETRKFGLALVFCTQRLGAIRERGEAVYNALLSVQTKIVFGGLAAGDSRLLAEELHMGELDLSRHKERVKTPTVIGHRLAWFDSESESTGEQETESDSHGSTDTDGESSGVATQFDAELGRAMPISSDFAGRSATHTEVAGHTTSRGRSWTRGIGRSRGLVPILAERSNTVYSLEEHLHLRATTLKNLPVGTAIAKVAGRRTARIVVPKMGGRAGPEDAARYRAARIALTPSAMPIARALAAVEVRQARLTGGEHGGLETAPEIDLPENPAPRGRRGRA